MPKALLPCALTGRGHVSSTHTPQQPTLVTRLGIKFLKRKQGLIKLIPQSGWKTPISHMLLFRATCFSALSLQTKQSWMPLSCLLHYYLQLPLYMLCLQALGLIFFTDKIMEGSTSFLHAPQNPVTHLSRFGCFCTRCNITYESHSSPNTATSAFASQHPLYQT